MPDNADIIEQITEILDENGTVPDRTRTKLMLAGILMMSGKLDSLMASAAKREERIERLERASIVLQAQAHPALAMFIGAVLFLIVMYAQQIPPLLAQIKDMIP